MKKNAKHGIWEGRTNGIMRQRYCYCCCSIYCHHHSSVSSFKSPMGNHLGSDLSVGLWQLWILCGYVPVCYFVAWHVSFYFFNFLLLYVYIKRIQKVSYCFFFLVKNTPKLINQQLKNGVKIVN